MKNLKTLSILFFFILQSILSFGQKDNLSAITNKYNSLLKEKNNGIAVLINKNKKTETASLGNYNLNRNSVFNIGSATKTFTAILILQELEKGNLKLSDSIGNYLTPIQNVDGSLTIETLLTHQSGLDEVIGKNIQDIFYAKSDSLYNDNLLYQIGKNNPKMIGKFDYCNTNYFLLGKIIEKVTDQNYFDLLRERIFMPLQINNTYPYVHKNIKNLATPIHDNKDVSQYLDYRYFANIAYSAGSIASTLIDMEIFYKALFETELLLKKETVKMMMESGNEFYGYGLFKSSNNGKIYYGHGGNNIGYAFSNRYNPVTKDLFLLFTNSRVIPLKESISKDLFLILNNETIENFKNIDIENFKKYAGSYLLKEANMIFKITLEGNKMYLIVESQGVKSELKQKSKNSVYDTTVGAILTKIEGSDSSLQFSQNDFTTMISKITSEE